MEIAETGRGRLQDRRHEVRPFGSDGGAPGELDSPEVLVPENGPEAQRRVRHPAHRSIQPQRRPSGKTCRRRPRSAS